MSIRLCTVSDIVVGYGSPQIIDFSQSLCEAMKTIGIICQPLMPQRQILDIDSSLLRLETIYITDHPFSAMGRIEYQKKSAKVINQYKPDVVIITNYSLLNLLNLLEYRPRKIIHLVLEDLNFFAESTLGQLKLSAFRSQANKLVDLWIFPEINRAINDAAILNIDYEHVSVFYNVSNNTLKNTSVVKKQLRFIYAGTLDVETSIGRIIFDPDLACFPIDVYGDLQGNAASKSIMQSKLDYLHVNNSHTYKLRWFGQVPISKINALLPTYSYSIIYWQPIRHALLYAAPNKFFQAILAGVPVISPPHPQVKMLVERYGCGLIIDGWEREHVIAGLSQGKRLIESDMYQEMSMNCKQAALKELSWSVQIGRWLRRFNVKDW